MTCLFSLLYGKNVTYITIPNSETFLYELKQVHVKSYTENNMGGVFS